MARKPFDDLGELQKEIMETIWELGEASVRQVQGRINKKYKKDLAYTSILSIIQRLEKQGWLKHRLEGRSYIFRSSYDRKQESIRAIKGFVDRVFQGNKRLLFQHLMEDEELTQEDLKELQQLIRKKQKGQS